MWDGEVAAQRELEAEITRELSARGLSSTHLDRAITRAAEKSGTVFTEELRKRFTKVQSEFSIPPAEWEEYLSRITVVASSNMQGIANNRVGDLTAKGLFASGGAVGAKLVSGVVTKTATAKIAAGASAAAAKGLAGKAALAAVGKGVAIKGGAAATAKGASLMGGPVVAGIVIGGLGIFEAFSHSSYVKEEKPKLRRRIDENLDFFAESLMANDGAIGEPLGEIEEGILESLAANSTELKD